MKTLGLFFFGLALLAFGATAADLPACTDQKSGMTDFKIQKNIVRAIEMEQIEKFTNMIKKTGTNGNCHITEKNLKINKKIVTLGDPVLLLAARFNKNKIVEKMLSDDKVDVNIFKASTKTDDSPSMYPLTKAVTNGNVDMVKMLVENEADVNCQPKYLGTPLMEAIKYIRGAYKVSDYTDNLEQIINILLENEADVNARDNDTWKMTPLEYLAKFPDVPKGQELIQILKDNGAGKDLVNEKDGKSACDYASTSKNEAFKTIMDC